MSDTVKLIVAQPGKPFELIAATIDESPHDDPVFDAARMIIEDDIDTIDMRRYSPLFRRFHVHVDDAGLLKRLPANRWLRNRKDIFPSGRDGAPFVGTIVISRSNGNSYASTYASVRDSDLARVKAWDWVDAFGSDKRVTEAETGEFSMRVGRTSGIMDGGKAHGERNRHQRKG